MSLFGVFRRSDGETSSEAMRDVLTRSRTIAMVGASPEQGRPSSGIMRYLQRAGYRVIPVNPQHAGDTLHGERVVAQLGKAGPIDLVNVFRRADAIGQVMEDAIAAGAPAIWIQLGIRNEPAAERGRAAGLTVIMDRCISVEHSRLVR